MKETLKKINLRGFSLEAEIQQMTANNLGEIFGLDCIDPEFQFGPDHNSGENRIDILAFDNELKSFVIIECKRKKTAGATEQGRRYFSAMNTLKAEVYAKYQDLRKGDAIPLRDIKWSKSRVILISTGYTKDQKGADDDPRIELWEVKRYENNTVSFSRVDKAASEVDSEYMFEVFSEKDSLPDSLTKEEQKHLTKWSREKTKDLYKKLRSNLPLGDIRIKCNEEYIDLIANGVIIAYVLVRQRKIKVKINIPKGKLRGAKKIMRDASEINSWPYADYDKDITSDKDLERIPGFVKQSLKYKGKKRRIRDE